VAWFQGRGLRESDDRWVVLCVVLFLLIARWSRCCVERTSPSRLRVSAVTLDADDFSPRSALSEFHGVAGWGIDARPGGAEIVARLYRCIESYHRS
jgi:hypothetical protein